MLLTNNHDTYPFQDGCHCEEGGRGDLGLVVLDGREEVLGRVVQPLVHLAEPLRVGRPEHDDFFHSRFGPESDNFGLIGYFSRMDIFPGAKICYFSPCPESSPA